MKYHWKHRSPFHKECGFVLWLTMAVVLVVLMISFALLTWERLDLKMIKNQEKMVSVHYLAEATLTKALGLIENEVEWQRKFLEAELNQRWELPTAGIFDGGSMADCFLTDTKALVKQQKNKGDLLEISVLLFPGAYRGRGNDIYEEELHCQVDLHYRSLVQSYLPEVLQGYIFFTDAEELAWEKIFDSQICDFDSENVNIENEVVDLKDLAAGIYYVDHQLKIGGKYAQEIVIISSDEIIIEGDIRKNDAAVPGLVLISESGIKTVPKKFLTVEAFLCTPSESGRIVLENVRYYGLLKGRAWSKNFCKADNWSFSLDPEAGSGLGIKEDKLCFLKDPGNYNYENLQTVYVLEKNGYVY